VFVWPPYLMVGGERFDHGEVRALARASQGNLASRAVVKEKAEHERTLARQKLEAEEKWEKEKVELEHDVVRRRLQREAAGTPASPR